MKHLAVWWKQMIQLVTADNERKREQGPTFRGTTNDEESGVLENELLVGANDQILAWCGHLRVLQTVLHVAKRFYHESNKESSAST